MLGLFALNPQTPNASFGALYVSDFLAAIASHDRRRWENSLSISFAWIADLLSNWTEASMRNMCVRTACERSIWRVVDSGFCVSGTTTRYYEQKRCWNKFFWR